MKISFSDAIYEKPKAEINPSDIKVAFTNAILTPKNIKVADRITYLAERYVSILAKDGFVKANEFFDSDIKGLPPADVRKIQLEISKLKGPAPSDKVSTESGVTGLVDKVKEISNKPGGAEELAKIQEQRYRTVKNLESLIPSSLISKYLGILLGDASLDEESGQGSKSLNINEEIAYALLYESATVSRTTGQPVEDIIEFSIAYFDKVQSIDLLVDILNTASDISKINRSIPLFKMLKDSAEGQASSVDQYVSGFETYDQYLVFASLISGIQYGPVEDQEQARRLQAKAKLELGRQLEKYNRKIMYVDMLKSTGVNKKLSEVIAGMSKHFDVLVKNRLYQAFLDTFYTLEAAQIARQAFMAPVTRARPQIQTGLEPINRNRAPSLNSSNNKVVLAQEKKEGQPKENIFPEIASVLAQWIEPFEKSFPGIKIFFDQIIKKLQSLDLSASEEEIMSLLSLNSYNLAGLGKQVAGATGQNPETPRTSNILVTNGSVRLAGGRRGVSKIFQFLQNGFAAYVSSAGLLQMKDLVQVIGLIIIFVKNVFNEYRANKKFELDDDFFDENGKLKNSQTLTNYRDVLSKIRVNNNMIQAVLTAMQVRTRIKNKLNDFEEEINRVVEIEVQTGATSGSTNAPLKNEGQLRKIYDQYIIELRGAISLFNQELALHKQIMQLANGAALDPINLNLISEKYRSCSADIQVIKNKLGKYSSFALIIENVARRSRFNRRLKLILAKAKKFQAIGLSTADIVTDPNGLLPILKQIRDNEVQGLEKLKKELVNRTTAGNASDIYLR
jgi:hypothetical protein